MSDGLTEREKLFIEEYGATLNGTRAYMVAYDAGSYNSASVGAYELLRKPHIKSAIAPVLEARAMPAREILARLAQHARGTIEPFIGDDGEIDLRSDKAKANIGLIKEITETEVTTKRGERKVTHTVKLHDPQAALVHLGRAMSMFSDNVNVSGNLELNDWREGKSAEQIAAVEAAAQLIAQSAGQMVIEAHPINGSDDVSIHAPSEGS